VDFLEVIRCLTEIVLAVLIVIIIIIIIIFLIPVLSLHVAFCKRFCTTNCGVGKS
jgi:hypothetical protein